jgi:hypothetical protein
MNRQCAKAGKEPKDIYTLKGRRKCVDVVLYNFIGLGVVPTIRKQLVEAG